MRRGEFLASLAGLVGFGAAVGLVEPEPDPPALTVTIDPLDPGAERVTQIIRRAGTVNSTTFTTGGVWIES